LGTVEPIGLFGVGGEPEVKPPVTGDEPDVKPPTTPDGLGSFGAWTGGNGETGLVDGERGDWKHRQRSGQLRWELRSAEARTEPREGRGDGRLRSRPEVARRLWARDSAAGATRP